MPLASQFDLENKRSRCTWACSDILNMHYHDQEWGVPLRDSEKLFELLNLEGMQAGLSWITVLKKRENYRQSFYQFKPEKIIRYSEKKIESLMENPGIIRNRLKINSIIQNARAYLELQEAGIDFSEYLWNFVDDKPIINSWKTHAQIPSKSPLSDQLSKDLKKRGFKFVGSTICYAFLQAAGLINDHTTHCFRYKDLS